METRSNIEASGPVSRTPIVPGIPLATLRTHPTSSASSTRNTLRNPHPNSKKPDMSTTATVGTNEGWTFAGRSHTSEFPISTSADNEQTDLPTNEPNNNWGIATTTTDGWGATPAAPSPPLSAAGQPHTNDHVSLHWMACYDDYCNTHCQSKDNNYYPHRSRRRRATNGDCPLPHPNELLEVTHKRRLYPAKECWTGTEESGSAPNAGSS